MDLIELALLGAFHATAGGQLITGFSTDKVRALLVYLSLERAQPQARSHLAALFWPALPHEAALDNLRKSLYRLRQAVAAAGPRRLTPTEWLIVNRQTVQLASERVQTDVFAFQNLLAECELHTHTAMHECDSCIARLSQAMDLYRGDLLAGFGLADAPVFEEWLLMNREILHQQALVASATLANIWEARADYARAYTFAKRNLALDPFREEAHRQAMRLLALQGRSKQALEQYEICRRLLDEELGVAPDPITTTLAEQIRTAVFPERMTRGQDDYPLTQSPSHHVTLSPAHGWDETPATGRVFGRQEEISTLTRWLVEEQCQLVALLGLGGVGKTTLAATVARAMANHFDIVIWRSLLNAPPLGELLHGVVQTLARQPLMEWPASLDQQLALLLEHLRKQRCLLVLDNLESILAPGAANYETDALRPFLAERASPGHEGYLQMLQQITEQRHRSALLFTSREQPSGMARREEDLPWVRSLRLEGLDASAGQAMLLARGLSGQQSATQALVTRYAGHPLALKLVAETVLEIFAGDVAQFLHTETLVFDDIRTVLDQQFARLSGLEREILFWLAIEREAVSASALRANLVNQSEPHLFLAGLRSLQHRSLLEWQDNGFTLQNVVMEYLTDRLTSGIAEEITQASLHNHPLTQGAAPGDHAFQSLLNRFAIVKMQSREYIRQSQERLILQPIAERVLARLSKQRIADTLRHLLEGLRTGGARAPGYAAGNLFNLARHLGLDLTSLDFSQLCVWEADLRGINGAAINFREADLTHAAFTLDFDLVAVQYGRDGQVLVAGIAERNICLWQAAHGQLRHAFQGLSNGSNPIVFSQDGRYLANASLEHMIEIWSVETGKRVHTLAGHTDKIYTLAFSADDQCLASSSRDGAIRVWDLQTGQCRYRLSEHASAISALAFSADGALLAGGGAEKLVCLWDAQSGKFIQTLAGHVREVECLAFTPDSKQLASGAHDGTIRLWDLASGECLYTLHGHSQIVRAVVIAPSPNHLPASGKWLLASGGADGIVRLWNVGEASGPGQVRHTLLGHKDEVISLAFSPKGHVLVSGSVDKTVQAWDTRTGDVLDVITGHSAMVGLVRFSPDGRQLAASSVHGVVHLWDIGNPGSKKTLRYLHGHKAQVFAIAYSPDGRLLASGGVGNSIILWDTETGHVHCTFHGHTGAIKSLAFSPDGQTLASASSDKTIALWRVGARQRAPTLQRPEQPWRVLVGHEDMVVSVAFSPDGRLLVSASLDHTARLWASDNGEEICLLRDHTSALYSAGFSPDGRLVVTNSWDYAVSFWFSLTGEQHERQNSDPLMQWAGGPLGDAIKIIGATLSPNGQILAGITPQQQIVLCDFATGQVLHTLTGHTSTVKDVSFSPTGSMLASSSWDGTICLWDTASGTCLDTLYTPGPYAGMDITGVTGITEAQRAALKALGAYEQSVNVQEADGREHERTDASVDQRVLSENHPGSVTRWPGDRIGDTPSSGHAITQSPGHAVALSPRHEWDETPETGRVFGRTEEISTLMRWLVEDRCRLVAVSGLGGVGKTTLAATVVKAASDHFDLVIWRPLLNAPLLDELLRSIMGALIRHKLMEWPANLDEQLTLLLENLRQQRCLLVLDNLESILRADGTGQMRAGYEGYAQLLQRLAESRHSSCLLLTSREQPGGMARWEEDLPSVRSLRLEGLDPSAGQAMLLGRGLTGQQADSYALVARYSGHPLALKLVAETIQELFSGDIAAFLRTETVVFDDIRTILDQQFARLSSLESEILIWLAIEREAITAQELYANLVPPSPSWRAFLEALRALQRRSLLEQAVLLRDPTQQHSGLTLQNVVSEYITDHLVDQIAQEILDEKVNLLCRHALVKVQTKEYIRQSQVRLILRPIVDQLLSRLGMLALVKKLQHILDTMRKTAPLAPGYAGGNIMNLLLHISEAQRTPDGESPLGRASSGHDLCRSVDIQSYDFSLLSVWQADLRGRILPPINFSQSDLSGSVFTETFDVVHCLAYSPDGRLVAAGIASGELRIWQLPENLLVRTIQAHTGRVAAIAFSPDGRMIASGGHDNLVRLWNVQTGSVVYSLQGHSGSVSSVAFAPDGKTLASGSDDETIRLWDVEHGQLVDTLCGHRHQVTCVVFSPEGDTLASGSYDHTISIWDMKTRALIHTLQGHSDSVLSIAFAPDGKILASGGGDRTVRFWDVRCAQCVYTLPEYGHYVRSVAFDPGGERLAIGVADMRIFLWDVRSQCVHKVIQGHTNAIHAVAFSHDGATLASGGMDKTVRLWSAHTGRLLHMLWGHINQISCVAFSPDGKMLASGSDDQMVRLWEWNTGEVLKTLKAHTHIIRAVVFSADNKTLASGAGDKLVYLWDAATGKIRFVLKGHTGFIHRLAISPDGRTLATSSSDRNIYLWDLRALEAPASGRVALRHTLIGHTKDVWPVVFSPDGNTLVSSGDDRKVYLWNVENGKLIKTLYEHKSTVMALAFSPNGDIVASAGYDRVIHVIDYHTNAIRYVLTGHTDAILSLDFSPDGRVLASCSEDQTVRLWDVDTGQLLNVMHGHRHWVNAVAFSPDGQILASSSTDETIKLWDVRVLLAPASGRDACLKTLSIPGPYAGMNITGAMGITDTQRATLKALGAYET